MPAVGGGRVVLSPLLAAVLGLGAAIVSAGVGVHLRRYRATVTEMLGMTIGMTLGMMTGIVVGYVAGAASDMFVSNLIGVAVGVAFGVGFGRAGGLMGAMDGGMGGLMGGMMGGMLGVMLQYLYDGWAIGITTVLIAGLYLASMAALVRLVRRSAAAPTALDPVCGMRVDPATALSTIHRAQTYHFCAMACLRAFLKDPDSHLGAPGR